MGQSETFSFSIDQNLVYLVFAIIFVMLGLFCIGVGLYVRWRGPIGSAESWSKQLFKWRVIGSLNVDSIISYEVRKGWSRVFSLALIGSGVGMIVETLLTATMTWLMTGNPFSEVYVFNGLVSDVGFYLGFVVGFCVGALWGVLRLRKAARRVTYADLRQRRLVDYRLALFRWLPVAVIAYEVFVTFLLAPHLGSKIQIELTCLPNLEVPNNLLTVMILPAAMAVILVIVEVALSRIAAFSRLLVVSDPVIARNADDMMRAFVLSMVQFAGFAMMGYLGMAQAMMLMQSVWAAHFWRVGSHPFSLLILGTTGFPLILQVLGFLMPACAGRLGGRVTGWPWQAQIKAA